MKNRVEKYIRFDDVENPGKKTRIWRVVSTNGGAVGTVKWWGAWRKYVFFPNTDTLYDKDCLRLMADFCEQQTKLQLS